MELALCHITDAYIFEVAHRFLQNVCTPPLNRVCVLLLQAYLDDIRQTADSMFDKYFSKEGKTFAVLFK
jgi:hypothetical protein